ncbi:MAG: hypothetical protein M1546_03360 [Chloroflexi bacterium]|nr:hypothetical protein [Chloroflexota bacterium]
MRDRLLAQPERLVFVLCLLLCLFTFSGKLQSVDELAVYALSYNLAQRGALDVNVLAATAPGMRAPPFSGVGQFGSDGDFYSGKGVLSSVLAVPLLRIALWLPGVDPVVAALLLNVLLTALTGYVIARHVRQRYCNDRAGIIAGILYVAATMALAYSKRLFTEPAAALCVVLAYHWVVRDWDGQRSDPARSQPHLLHSFGAHFFFAGLVLGAAVAAAYSIVVVLPCFGILIVWVIYRLPVTLRKRCLLFGAFLAGLLSWIIILALYNLTRFGDVTRTGLSLLTWSLPYFTWQAALTRLYGLLFSPYRGLFWYNPLLLLAPLLLLPIFNLSRAGKAQVADKRRTLEPAFWIAPGATLALLLILSAWSMWWGGFNWGPRFLLPVMPLWVLALAPQLSGAMMPLRLGMRVFYRIPLYVLRCVVVGILALSMTTSLVGGLSNTFRSEGVLAARGQLGPLVAPRSLADSSLLTDWEYFQGVSGGVQLIRGEFDTWWHRREPAIDHGLAQAISDLSERATADSAVLIVAPGRVEPFLHVYRLAVPLYGLAPDQTDVDTLKRRMLSGYRRILLLTDAGQTDSHNVTEMWLEQNGFRARNEFYEDWRVAVFGTLPAPTVTVPVQAQFGSVLHMRRVEYAPSVQPGGVVAIRVWWQRGITASTELDDVAWFAHLYSPAGDLVSQHDAPVGDGYGWDGAGVVDDRRGILVPPDAPSGQYWVNVGVYKPDGQRLNASNADGPLPEGVVSFPVRVSR